MTPPPLIRLAGPDIGPEEQTAVLDVLSTPVLTNGPFTRRFEQAFAARHQVSEAVAFCNGSVALAAIHLALGVGPGDEVIVPSLTFISSATTVAHVGATPVFADVVPDTLTLDPADVATRLTDRTTAIVAVHYGGQPADMDELATIAADAGVALVEDAAQAHGSSYRGRPVGSLGRAAMFSFTATKNITTGEGGVVTTDDVELAQQLRLLRNHGQTELYRHDVVGFNWRITEMQAAMGVAQVGKLDRILDRKRRNAAWMTDRLSSVPGVGPPVTRSDRDHVFMLYTLTLDRRRDDVLHSLNEAGIESRVYFPAAHLQPIFRGQGSRLPVTEELCRRIVSIPMHSRLTSEELERISTAVEEAVASVAAS